jgi:hypothetical protein
MGVVGTDLTIIERGGTKYKAKLDELAALLGSPPDRTDPTVAQSFVDDFLGGSNETGEVGELGWNFTNGSMTALSELQNHPGVYRRTGSATANQVCAFRLHGNLAFRFDEFHATTIIFKETLATTDATWQIGILSTFTSLTQTHGCYLEVLPADANWFFVTNNGTSPHRVDSGVAQSTGWIKIRIRRVSSTIVAFSINGGAEVQLSTNIPDAADAFDVGVCSANTSTTARVIDLDFWSLKMLPITR